MKASRKEFEKYVRENWYWNDFTMYKREYLAQWLHDRWKGWEAAHFYLSKQIKKCKSELLEEIKRKNEKNEAYEESNVFESK